MQRKWLLVGVCAGVLCGCGPGAGQGSVEGVYTDLWAKACKQKVDREDPNFTPYLRCGGVEGYSLIVRMVDSGRQSVEVVDPGGRRHALDFHETVTRHMSSVEGRAEWRVAAAGVKREPVALIVPVLAHEDDENPERVTRIYLAVSKITAEKVCVTARFVKGEAKEEELRAAADGARGAQCVPPLPALGEGVAQ